MILEDNQILVCSECQSANWIAERQDDDKFMYSCIMCGLTWHESENQDHLYEKVSVRQNLKSALIESIELLKQIQRSRKASAGGIRNVYTPLLDVEAVDKLAAGLLVLASDTE